MQLYLQLKYLNYKGYQGFPLLWEIFEILLVPLVTTDKRVHLQITFKYLAKSF
jgi:hypothetical protein